MSISITWHGHATFTLEIDGTHIVIDPFFAGNNPAATRNVADISADSLPSMAAQILRSRNTVKPSLSQKSSQVLHVTRLPVQE